MVIAGYRKLGNFAPFLAIFCVVCLFVTQLGASFGHDERSHTDSLEQICDYCIAEKGLTGIDSEADVDEILYFCQYKQACANKVVALRPSVYSLPLSRAPPLLQNI